MMDVPRSNVDTPDDFNKRLEKTLARLKNKPKPGIIPLPPTSHDPDFEQRLQQAMSSVRGEDVTKPTKPSQETETDGGGPIGTGDHIVRIGECVSSIAKKHGLFWESIWHEPANADLRAARKSPNVLLPGDRLTLPDKKRKDEPIAPEQRHRFVRRGEPSSLNMRFTVFGKPRANAMYEAYIDRKLVQEGTLDGNGGVEVPLPSNARRAKFMIYDEYGEADEYEIWLRHVPPITEISGLQARLANLGFPCGRNARRFGPAIAQALETFQREHDLPTTGLPDKTTRARILELHGC